MNSKEWLSHWRKLYRHPEFGFGRAILLATVCVGLATALRLALSAIGATLAFATYFPAVLFSALIGGRASGLLSILFSLVAAWWAVYEPQFAFGPLNRVMLANFVLFFVSASVIVFLALMHRATVFELQDRDKEIRLLAGEVRHRSANLLTVVFGLVRQSFRDPADAKKLMDRINASVATDGLLDEASGGPIALKDVFHEAVCRQHEGRVGLDGPDHKIDRETAKGLRLALHEMATNALKYGALSEDKGRVIIRSQVGDGVCKVEWLEQDGPKVSAPTKFNFGTRLIKQSLAQIDASLEAEYAEDGYKYVITIPMAEPTKVTRIEQRSARITPFP